MGESRAFGSGRAGELGRKEMVETVAEKVGPLVRRAS